MNKNTKQDYEVMVAEMTELYGDMPVEMTFREVKEGIDSGVSEPFDPEEIRAEARRRLGARQS